LKRHVVHKPNDRRAAKAVTKAAAALLPAAVPQHEAVHQHEAQALSQPNALSSVMAARHDLRVLATTNATALMLTSPLAVARVAARAQAPEPARVLRKRSHAMSVYVQHRTASIRNVCIKPEAIRPLRHLPEPNVVSVARHSKKMARVLCQSGKSV
jgi:hypothetical protein